MEKCVSRAVRRNRRRGHRLSHRQFSILVFVLIAGFGSLVVTAIVLRPLTTEEQAERQAERQATKLNREVKRNRKLVRNEFDDLSARRIIWRDISSELLRAIETTPGDLGMEALVVMDTVVALRRVGLEIDKLAVREGGYPKADKHLKEVFGNDESWWLKDGWGNYFFWSESPAPESRTFFGGFLKDNYLRFTIMSGGPDGRPFTGFGPYISGFYCYDIEKVIWCVPPEGPDCDAGLPITLDERLERDLPP